MGEPGFLFIGGCARSGTSGLWRVVTAHPGVALGLDRYVGLTHRPEQFTPDLFERERFLDIRKGDTFYDSFAYFRGPQYEKVVTRFDSAQLRGDKIPMLHPLYEQLAKVFPDSKILYILRNPFDVAASFQMRATNPKDPDWQPMRDYRVACRQWNASLQATLKWSKRLSFYVIDYESFFSGQGDVAALAAFLEIEPDDLARGYQREVARVITTDPRDALTKVGRQYVSRRADFDAYRELLEMADGNRLPGSPPARIAMRSGKKYAAEDRSIVDYQYYEAVPGKWFRGPPPKSSRKPSIAFLGAASTFGRFVKAPYPSIVAAKLGAEAVNLGFGGARAPFYSTDYRLMALINKCDCAVIELFSARGTATPLLEPRNHQSAFIRFRGAESEFQFADHFFASLLKGWSRDDLERLADDIRQSYLEDMAGLLARIEIPKLLLWFSQRPPGKHFGFGSLDEFMGRFPHFVTARLVEDLREKADGFVEVVTSAGLPNRLTDAVSGEPVPIYKRATNQDLNYYYPSPLMHEAAAEALREPLAATLASTSSVTVP